MADLDLSFDALIARNKTYASTIHRPLPPLLTLLGGDASAVPRPLFISCLDSRCDPYKIFQLPPLSILSLRTVGGRVGPMLPHIAALDSFFRISQIVILQHTNCGASHVSIEDALVKIKRDCVGVGDENDEVELLSELGKKLPFHDGKGTSLKEDLRLVRECTFLRRELIDGGIGREGGGVKGLWLDVGTGLVTEMR